MNGHAVGSRKVNGLVNPKKQEQCFGSKSLHPAIHWRRNTLQKNWIHILKKT